MYLLQDGGTEYLQGAALGIEEGKVNGSGQIKYAAEERGRVLGSVFDGLYYDEILITLGREL
jgi:hypothetical protein